MCERKKILPRIEEYFYIHRSNHTLDYVPCGEHKLFVRPEKVYSNVFLYFPSNTHPTPFIYSCLGLRELLYISRVSQITVAEKSVIKIIIFLHCYCGGKT